MVNTCCVPICKSVAKRNSKISFHTFPNNAVIRQQWLHAIRRNPDKLNLNSVPRVCSNHFTEEQYLVGTLVRKLKKNAIPTSFPWIVENECGENNNSSVSMETEINTHHISAANLQTLQTEACHVESSSAVTMQNQTSHVQDLERRMQILEAEEDEDIASMPTCETEVKEEPEFVNIENYNETQFDTLVFENISGPPTQVSECASNTTTDETTKLDTTGSSLEKLNHRLDEVYKIVKRVSYEQLKRDQCSLYGELLAIKLRNFDENARQVLMNEIDDLVFRMSLQLRASSSSENSTQLESPPTNKGQPSRGPFSDSFEISEDSACDIIKEEDD